jgi:hypothetical protein
MRSKGPTVSLVPFLNAYSSKKMHAAEGHLEIRIMEDALREWESLFLCGNLPRNLAQFLWQNG